MPTSGRKGKRENYNFSLCFMHFCDPGIFTSGLLPYRKHISCHPHNGKAFKGFSFRPLYLHTCVFCLSLVPDSEMAFLVFHNILALYAFCTTLQLAAFRKVQPLKFNRISTVSANHWFCVCLLSLAVCWDFPTGKASITWDFPTVNTFSTIFLGFPNFWHIAQIQHIVFVQRVQYARSAASVPPASPAACLPPSVFCVILRSAAFYSRTCCNTSPAC